MKSTPFVKRLSWLVLVCGLASVAHAAFEVTSFRYYPATGQTAAMVGGRVTGSNESATNGFVELGRIAQEPTPGAWNELLLPGAVVYRYVKYEAPPGSGGVVAEVEFYNNAAKLSGTALGTSGSILPANGSDYNKALDGDTATYFLSNVSDNQYVGLDLGSAVQVAKPSFSPAVGLLANPVQVTISCSTAGATIVYTIDGTTPTRTNGTVIASGGKISVSGKTTLAVFAYKEAMADSFLATGTYLFSGQAGPGLVTWHGGNSLTDTFDGWLQPVAQSAGFPHRFERYTIPGAPTDWNWTHPEGGFGGAFKTTFDTKGPFDHMTTQPFSGHGRSVDNESFYSNRFFQRARYKYADTGTVTTEGAVTVTTYLLARDADNNPIPLSPDVQPWFYIQWSGASLGDSWTLGTHPDLTTDNLWPGATTGEMAANHVVYFERLRARALQIIAEPTFSYVTGTNQREVVEQLADTKPPLILPVGVALGRLRDRIRSGLVPGLTDAEFSTFHFSDGLHMDPPGRYLAALVAVAALYQTSPEGLASSAGTSLTPEQALIYQHVAWDTVANYPYAGIYQEGTIPVEPPTLSPAPTGLRAPIRLTIESPTPDSWVRYTLNGTDPTPTSGLLYTEPVMLRPGSSVRAVAFQNGFAPSTVVSGDYPAWPGDALLAEEAFNFPTGTLHQKNNLNKAWGTAWTVQFINSADPGTYVIPEGGGLTYLNLVTSGGRAMGGQSNASCGRQFATTALSPWVAYLKNNRLDPRGRSLWWSVLLQKDQSNDDQVAIYLAPNSGGLAYSTGSAIAGVGYFGTSSNNGGIRYWGLRIGSTTYRSPVPITPGQPVLLALQLESGSPNNTLRLYVNPADLGGAAPASPSALGTTTSALQFLNVAYNFSTPAAGSVDEIRLGESFAAVTPVTNGYATWAADRFTAQEIADGRSARDALPANDGFSNLLKYALGVADPKLPVRPSHLVWLQSDLSEAAQFRFRRARSDLDYFVETSADLVTWQTVSANPEVTGAEVAVDLPPVTLDAPAFYRLRVAEKP